MDIWEKVQQLALIPGEHEINESDYEGVFNIGDVARGRTPSGNSTYEIGKVTLEGYVYPRGWIAWSFGRDESDPEYVSIRVLRKAPSSGATFGFEYHSTPTSGGIEGGRGGTGCGYL